MSGTTTTHRVAQATPQNSWTRAGQSAATALSQYAGAVKTDASFCAINSTEETVANFADDSAEAPHWVVDLPSASFVTHRVFMGVTAGTIAGNLPNMGCSIGLAYFRQSRDNESFSPEAFATIDCYLTSTAIPMTAKERPSIFPATRLLPTGIGSAHTHRFATLLTAACLSLRACLRHSAMTSTGMRSWRSLEIA